VAVTRAPDDTIDLVVRLHAPLGQPPQVGAIPKSRAHQDLHRIALPASPGEALDIMVEVEKLSDGAPVDARLTTNAAEHPAEFLRIEPTPTGEEERLNLEFDKRVWLAHVRLGTRLPDKPLHLRVEGVGFSTESEVFFTGRQADERSLRLVGWAMPSDASGQREPHRMADQITMPNPVWRRIAAWFRVRSEAVDYLKPFAYQTVRLRNDSPQRQAVMVTCDVVQPDTGESVGYFVPPTVAASGGMARVQSFAVVEPGAAADCVLPLFVSPETIEGTYLRRLTVSPMGSDRTILVREAPLGVVRTRPFFTLWVIAVSLLSLVWLALVVLFYRRLVQSLGVRRIVLLSLFGSLQFCLGFVGGIISSVLYVFLGPFNCLVGGLFTAVISSVLLASTLHLVPRVGAVSLAGIVSYVMGGVLFGSFGVTDLLFVGSSIAFREALLALSGVTTLRGNRRQAPAVVPMMLAVGLAEAASLFTSLALYGVFYRLFYARWYIALQVCVTGFAYSALGVRLGRPLGLSLRKVQG
jgi:hypothetical protein